MRVGANIDALFGATIPELRPRPDLGLPDAKELIAHLMAEHGGDSGYRVGDVGMLDGLVAFGGFECCPTWPTDAELAAARRRIGEPR